MVEGRSWYGRFYRGVVCPSASSSIRTLSPPSPEYLTETFCLGCGQAFLRAGAVAPELWSRGRGREKGVWLARLSPPLAPPPPFCGCPASARSLSAGAAVASPDSGFYPL